MTTQLIPSACRTAVLTAALAFAALPAHAALVVTPTNSGAVLAGAIAGSGVTINPLSISYSGANSGASGLYSGGTSAGIGINSGVILTTGNAAGAPGPNNSDSYTGSGSTTSLSFQFTTTGGDLFFNYVFASDEYTEYAGSGFNDTFKLFVDGVNIAIVPGTGSTPVEINTVNHFSHSALFNNNDPSFGPPPYNIQYDGFTDVFQAQALGLSAGTHTMQFLIADVGDSAYDSAVFVQANSFSDTPTPTVPDGGMTLALLGSSLFGLAVLRRSRR